MLHHLKSFRIEKERESIFDVSKCFSCNRLLILFFIHSQSLSTWVFFCLTSFLRLWKINYHLKNGNLNSETKKIVSRDFFIGRTKLNRIERLNGSELSYLCHLFSCKFSFSALAFFPKVIFGLSHSIWLLSFSFSFLSLSRLCIEGYKNQ